ncbi:ATPase inhibitor B, mitochondrial-like [Tribolium madens]|uniref:ATPase inhibitor B, mitochondrial-like n=1 Tax=Tribolium madens TaxID=41895 RepID=UPI001CF763C1|nr:ATPase inhibitor B, mitochondrial-like [Tribolium madens]
MNCAKFRFYLTQIRFMSQLGDLGSGVGRGGGGMGSIRIAGGAFGRIQAAREEGYFHKKQKQQMVKLREEIKDDIKFHREQIKKHEEAIKKHDEKMLKKFGY